MPHPGEKRQLALAEQLCPRLPRGAREQVEGLLHAAGVGDAPVLARVDALLAALDALLAEEGLAAGE